MIPQAFIQDLLARVDIVDVVGRYVKLRKGGANYLGLCPFHAEKSPSFTVSPGKQFYHCFGCGAHGSAIGFLMEHAGLGYVDAIGELARSLGLEVPHEPGRGGPAEDPRTPGLLELLARADLHYRRRLRDSSRAIEYLKRRGLTGRAAARFGIGYAPDQWRGLEAAVPDYDEPGLVEAGLVIEGEGDEGRKRRYDRFRDRIMFPIRNPRGQVIGFGGRVLDRGEPKYLNSPETPVFSKGRELYGIYEGRDAIRREDCAIVVEGYMDVVMLAQHGVANAVATLGTATTPDHVRKLLRLVDRIVFAFDGDAAGRKAAWRALEASLPQAADAKRIDFLFLPSEHDPDSFVRERGADGFREALADAMPLSELLVRDLSERTGLDTPEARARFLVEARPLLKALAAPALRMQLVHRTAELTRLSVAEVDGFLSADDERQGRGEMRGGRGEAGVGRGEGAGHGEGPGYGDGSKRREAAGHGDADRQGRDGRRGEADRHEAGEYRHGGGWQGRTRFVGGGAGSDGRGGSGAEGGPGGPNVMRRGRGRFDGTGRPGWRRFDPEGDGWVPRAPVENPDLESRVKLLLALHPGLAAQVERGEWLSPRLLEWVEALTRLPAGSTAGNVVRMLRDQSADEGERLERELASDAAALADLSTAEAASELVAATEQLRDRHLRRQIDALVAAGIHSDEDRARYHSLMAMRRRP